MKELKEKNKEKNKENPQKCLGNYRQYRQCKDEILLERVDHLRKIERETTATLLEYIQEIQRRRLFCDLGYSSLFEYLTQHLKYSESQASRRIAAARLITQNDLAKEKIEKGCLNLTTASDLSRYFNKEKIKPKKQEELIEKASGMSKRQCEELILSERKIERTPTERIHKVTPELTRLHINASDHTMAKIKRVKDLYGHLEYDELLALLCDVAIEKKEKEVLKTAKSEKKTKGRSLSIQTKRKVYQRASGRCEWQHASSKKRCQSRGKLEYDHIRPVALGGGNESENIRLLCRNHNLRAAIKTLGQEKMEKFTSPGALNKECRGALIGA
jgi:hypothetical protein